MSRMQPSVPELTCQELVELVTDYIEDALPENERTRLEQHLATCDGCDLYVEQMRQTIQALGTLQEQDIAPDVQEKLLTVFRRWRSA